MAWVAVDKDGFEAIYEEEPCREFDCVWAPEINFIHLPPGSIKKLIGRELTWSDEPVEI